MDEEKALQMLLRIKLSADGPDFINYLEQLSYENYRAYKEDPAEMNELHKGYALAVDSLIDSFRECGKERKTKDVSDLANAHY